MTTILTLEIVPAIFSIWHGRRVEWVKGPQPPRKRREDLSHQFVSWEKEAHQSLATPTTEARSGFGS